mgnify:CR=1 FL=1
MALGNSTSMGQARGKNKAVIVKRRKDEYNARNYTAFSTAAAETGNTEACAISTGSMTIECFHDGSHGSNLPFEVGDKVYTRKEADLRFYLPDGYYKIGPDRGRYYSIQVTNGAVAARTAC